MSLKIKKINWTFKIFFSNLLIFFVLILLIDNLLFSFPNLFPKKIVRYLSKETQIKYYYKSLQSPHIHMIYDDYIYYYKPNLYIKEHNATTDTFGYKNPKNLINENINILIVGDSYTEAIEMGQSFRQIVDPKTYSIGIGGQGIFHWKHQLKRFYKNYKNSHPKIVILNYYEGNDIIDSLRAIKVIKETKSINSIYYPVSESYEIEIIDSERKIFKEIHYLSEVFYKDIFLKNYYIFKHSTKNLIKKIIKWENNNPSIKQFDKFEVKFDNNCIITLDKEMNKYNHKFSKRDYEFIKNELLKTKKVINKYSKTNTKIYLGFIPSGQTVYLKNEYIKMQKNYKFDEYISNHIKHVNFIKKIANDLEIEFINPSKKIQQIASKKSLNICNKNDSHFNKYGYLEYVRVLKDLINL